MSSSTRAPVESERGVFVGGFRQQLQKIRLTRHERLGKTRRRVTVNLRRDLAIRCVDGKIQSARVGQGQQSVHETEVVD